MKRRLLIEHDPDDGCVGCRCYDRECVACGCELDEFYLRRDVCLETDGRRCDPWRSAPSWCPFRLRGTPVHVLHSQRKLLARCLAYLEWASIPIHNGMGAGLRMEMKPDSEAILLRDLRAVLGESP